jgi:hypothetical protein
MKMTEIIGGLRIPLSNEEDNLVNKVKSNKLLEFSKLNEREKELLIGLVRKNVINMEDGKVTFNGLQHPDEAIW